MKLPRRLRGLYAITDQGLATDDLLSRTEQILLGGAAVVQFRDKGRGPQRDRSARELLALCSRHGALFIVNDDINLAKAIGAHGVHIGRDDAALALARTELGNNAVIGVSCYDRLELAQQAVAGGADYVAFGSFFPSPTKPDAVRADTTLLAQAQALEVPVVAIGGITPDNGAALIEAGADALAVISAVYRVGDPQQSAARFKKLFD